MGSFANDWYMSRTELQPDRNLALELVRVTEAAAISAARLMGRIDKIAGDGAAVDAMRRFLSTVQMRGTVVIGEGEKDEAPMLFNGEVVGNGEGPEVDVAVDPVEGTNLLAYGRDHAISVIAVAERHSMWDPGPSLYMKKIVVNKEARHAIDIRLPVGENLQRVAEALGRPVSDLTVFVLDKPRHALLIDGIRKAGARLTLHSDGDVMGSLLAAIPGTGVDMLIGTGGTPEGVISATAVKALGAGMQGMRDPQKDYEKAALHAAGIDLDEVLGVDDLVRSDNTFFAATGITGGSFLEGVHFDRKGGVTTHSLVIRSRTGSMRYVQGIHQLDKKEF